MDEQPRLLRLAEAADRLGCSARTVKRIIQSGRLTAVRLRVTGERPMLRISEAEIARFIREALDLCAK